MQMERKESNSGDHTIVHFPHERAIISSLGILYCHDVDATSRLRSREREREILGCGSYSLPTGRHDSLAFTLFSYDCAPNPNKRDKITCDCAVVSHWCWW